MKVTVHLHSTLQIETPAGPKRRVVVDLEPGATIQSLIGHLKIQTDPARLLLGLNGEVAGLTELLQDGDHVHLMLPASGGGSETELGI